MKESKGRKEGNNSRTDRKKAEYSDGNKYQCDTNYNKYKQIKLQNQFQQACRPILKVSLIDTLLFTFCSWTFISYNGRIEGKESYGSQRKYLLSGPV